MKQVEMCLQNLVWAIRDSEEYQHFCRIRDKVKEEPELREQINKFRIHVFDVQNSPEPLDMYDEQKKLCRDYEEFRKNPLVNDYLQAELRICRMLQKITLDIAGAVDLDSQSIAEHLYG